VSLAVRLLLEPALLRRDVGLARAVHIAGRLDEAARSARVCRRLSAGEADYLRTLALGRAPEQVGAVTVPVQLLARLDELDLDGALDGDALQAVSWEAAAVIEGRTMLEWGLLTVLRGTGGR
jgi:hypothetical protein